MSAASDSSRIGQRPRGAHVRQEAMRAGASGTVRPSGRLLYIMGASGSGKDSVLNWVAAALTPDDRVVIAHRYITRASGGGEASIPLTPEEFERRAALGTFALHWRSHGLGYGIGTEIDVWLANGLTVLVNGSREYLAEACSRYPQIEAIEIVVSSCVLRARLLQRGRETAAEIEERLSRAPSAFEMPPQCSLTRIENDQALEEAGAALLSLVFRTPAAAASEDHKAYD